MESDLPIPLSARESNKFVEKGPSSLIPRLSGEPRCSGVRKATFPVSGSETTKTTARGIPEFRSKLHIDKQSNKINPEPSTPILSRKSNTFSSQKQSSNGIPMLDKFKFFKDKDKDKDKNKGVVRSSSKSSSASTTSRSDTESRASSNEATKSPSFSSSQSSSSGDNTGLGSDGAPDGPANAAASHYKSGGGSGGKSGKKSLAKAGSCQRDVPGEQVFLGLPPPIPSAVGLGLPSNGTHPSSFSVSPSSQRNAVTSQGRKSTSKSDRQESRQTDSLETDALNSMPRLSTDSSTPSASKKASKNNGSSSIPKTQSSSVSSTKSSKAATSTASLIPTSPSSTSISASSSGIPKPSSSKSGKSSRQERSRTGDEQKATHKDHSSVHDPRHFGAGTKPTSSSSSSSSSHHHLHQLQQQTFQQSQQHLYTQQQQQQQQAYQLRQQQEQQQKQHYPQTAYILHQHPQQQYHSYSQHIHSHHVGHYASDNYYSRPHGYIPHYAHNPGYATPSKILSSPLAQNIHSRTELQTMEQHQQQQQLGDHVGVGSSSQQRSSLQASHYAPVTISAPKVETQFAHMSLAGRSPSQTMPQSPLMNPNLGRQGLSVNVVKPTMSISTPTTTSHKSSKSDSNTQTNLSVLRKSAKQISLDSGISPQTDAMRVKTSSSFSRAAYDAAVGSHDSGKQIAKELVLASNSNNYEKPANREAMSCDAKEQNGVDSTMPGLFKLNMAQIPEGPVERSPAYSNMKTGSNVAVVQPRSGEKMETTFDTEVRTETVHKLSPDSGQSKETTFMTPDQEEKATFVDDAGEAMDIKPMPPIMRALPYGYFRGSSGYSGFNNQNFHIPAISVPTTSVYASRSPSGQILDMPRPLSEQTSRKFPSEQMKRTGSGSCPESTSSDPDYTSESDTYECVSGYMSDGDILKTNRNNGVESGDEWTCGYMSEGGASLYARRLQQRFREGMQAVRDCMQKSSGIMDDDSFEDSSSISSGDVSDTVPENSTDDKLTGSSQDALSDSLYQSPKGIFSTSPKSPGAFAHLQSSVGGIKIPSLGPRAVAALENHYSKDPVFGIGSTLGRKFSLPQTGGFLSSDPNKLLSSDPSDYGYGFSWPSSRSDGGFSSMRKLSAGSTPDYSYHSEGDYDSPHGSFSPGVGIIKDTEINTDQSHLFEVSMRRLQAGRLGNAPLSNTDGPAMQFGYTRPLSIPTSASGESRRAGSHVHGYGSSTTGSRLAKYGVDPQRSAGSAGIPRPASATDKPLNPDLATMDGYTCSSLDRKKTNVGLTSSRSAGCTQPERDFQSNSLGRLSLFGSKDRHPQTDHPGSGFHPAAGTVISNPHATYGADMQISHYVNLQELHARISGSSHTPIDFTSSPRNSVTGSPSLGPGINGSTLSLVSSSSSLFSSAEERHAHEVRKLKRDLLIAQDKVQALSSQLCTNLPTKPIYNISIGKKTVHYQSRYSRNCR